ncbi:SusD/RagB family nutrient-binding outer membrane lipoprotein [Coprobacter tertius]|uniref:SusD/RagB family nutrient-binding outer membrane lipoprotein n=1 Tax=Coprobacter tertius TaxID=2944915 RepID=A0ABT1MJJ8_9BACT|nr:SusD/RagB family nutrient-binding outer membrane lipoprotein [Coprobacter tertius]MCP9612539.1 SusD/RagB family nutrient-binding outer membrane lipoprotein [Coprobacter tertius]
MKRNKILRYTLLLVFAIGGSSILTGCTDDFEDMNTNKVQVDPDDLPFSSQFMTPMTYCYPPQQNRFQFWTNLSIDYYGGYFMTPNGNFTNGDYGENRGHSGGMGEVYYLYILNNTSRLIKSCEQQGYNGLAGVMRIVQAYGTQMMTDTYGPIAYSSVINQTPSTSTFPYDKQEDIYNSMFTDIDKAIADIKATTSTEELGILKAADYWCGGNKDLWLKVANTLKLRLAMRIVKVKPQIAETKAVEAVTDGVLTSADGDITINKNLENELWLMFDWGDCRFNASLVTMMTGFKDPRLPLYMTKNINAVMKLDAKPDPDTGKYQKSDTLVEKGTKYLGIRIGSGLPPKPNPWSNFSGWLPASSYTMPLPIMKVAEAYFLRAEGALRGWNMGGTAGDLYNEGIKVSLNNELKYRGSYAGITAYPPSAVTDYINGTTGQDNYVDPVDDNLSINALNTLGVKWDEGASNEEKLQRIITQKWLALFPLSNEAWAEYRRTGYPKLFPVKFNESNGAVNTDKQIRRSIYGGNEYNTNEAELLKGIELLNQENSDSEFSGDKGGTRVWWDRADKGNF